MPKLVRYYFRKLGANFVDFKLDYPNDNLSLIGSDVVYVGSSGVDRVYVAKGVKFTFNNSGTGTDEIYLDGSFADYSLTAIGTSTLLLTSAAKANTSITLASEDKVFFSDGSSGVRSLITYAAARIATPSTPLPTLNAAENSLTLPSTTNPDNSSRLDSILRAYTKDPSGVVFAQPHAGVEFILTGHNGVDKVYVSKGGKVNANNLGTGVDLIYLTGNKNEYSPTAVGTSVLVLTKGTERVTVASEDRVIFADGSTLVKAAISAVANWQSLSLDSNTRTPGLSVQVQIDLDSTSGGNDYSKAVNAAAAASGISIAPNAAPLSSSGNISSIKLTLSGANWDTTNDKLLLNAAAAVGGTATTVELSSSTADSGEISIGGIPHLGYSYDSATKLLTISPSSGNTLADADAEDVIRAIHFQNSVASTTQGTRSIGVVVNNSSGDGPVSNITLSLDTLAPAMPTLALGTGVSDGTTAAEATALSGVVSVMADSGSTVLVTFSDSASPVHTLIKTFTGNGSARSVTLDSTDLGAGSNQLQDGSVSVTATATDAIGNTSTAGTDSFTLDTLAPIINSRSLSVSENTQAVGTATISNVESVTWAKEGSGGDNALFDIDSVTGAITWVTATGRDFEAATKSAAGSNSYTLSVSATDAAGNKSTQAITVNLTDVNEAPVNAVPAAALTVNEDTLLAISNIRVSDTDAGANGIASVSLDVVNGKLRVSTTAAGGLTAAGVRGNDSNSITLTGTATAVNATLATLGYQGSLNFNGTDTLTVQSNDGGSPVLMDSDTVSINVTAVNDAPTIADIPTTTVDISNGVPVALADFSVSDVDSTTVYVTLVPSNGSISGFTVGSTNGVTTTLSGSSTVQLQGSAADISTALAAATFTSTATGAASIAVRVSDDSLSDTSAASSNSANYRFNVVNTPVLSIISGQDAYINSTETGVDVELTVGNLASGDTVQLKLGGTAIASSLRTVTSGEASDRKISLTIAKGDLGADGSKSITATVTQSGTAVNSNALSLKLDTVAPPTPTLALGTGVTRGATYLEAIANTGVVLVNAESASSVLVTFTDSGSHSFIKTLTGTGSLRAVTLVSADIGIGDSKLQDGNITVSATATDAAGNTSTAGTASFSLDTEISTPTLALGIGVSGGATAAEATAVDGVVTVIAELASTVLVTFTDSASPAHSLVKTVTGTGAELGVTLGSSDISGASRSLQEGNISVIAVSKDAAGNESSVRSSFTLDTVPPLTPTIELGAGVSSGATYAEATAATGVVSINAEVGSTVLVTFSDSSTHTVIKSFTGTGTAIAVVLASNELGNDDGQLSDGSVSVTATISDAAGNISTQGTASFTLDHLTPTLTGVALAGKSETTYSALNVGDKITVSATFTTTANDPVVITGSPRIALTIGSSTRYAIYDSNNAANTNTVKHFVYTVAAGDTDDNGVAIAANVLSLNGGTIGDAAGNAVDISHTEVTDNTSYTIDTTTPTLIAGANAVEANGGYVTLKYSETLDSASGTQPTAADFSVSGHTVTGVSLSGSNVVLAVTPAFVYDSTHAAVTVSYTGGDGSKIHDFAGNGASNLTNQSAPNNTPDAPFTSTLAGVGTAVGSAALDVSSNLVFTAIVPMSKNVTANGQKFIRIVNDIDDPANVGFHGENVKSDQIIDVNSSIVTLSANGRTITVNPGNDLDFANHYHIEVDAGAFKDASNVGNLAFSGFAFNTVLPMLVTDGASSFGRDGNASLKYDSASNSLVPSYKWIDMEGRGDADLQDPLTNGRIDVSTGNFALVTADYESAASVLANKNASPPIEKTPGIRVENFQVALDNFGTNDLIYVDNLGRTEFGSLKALQNPVTIETAIATVPLTAPDGKQFSEIAATLNFEPTLDPSSATAGGAIYLGFSSNSLGNRANGTAINTTNVTWDDLYDKGVVIYG